MKESFDNPHYNEADTLQDLLEAEREGERDGLEGGVDLGLHENASTALEMLTRDQEKIKKVREDLSIMSQQQINHLDSGPLPEAARPGVDVLKKNHQAIFQQPKKSFWRRISGL